jgi:hypothetical protein
MNFSLSLAAWGILLQTPTWDFGFVKQYSHIINLLGVPVNALGDL